MVKAYLRYEPRLVFGVIASPESNISYDSSGKHLISPALDSLSLWSPRQGVLHKLLSTSPSSPNLAITAVSVASSPSHLAASGHADGSVRLWDLETGSCEATFNGHGSAVASLRFDAAASVLASGGKDCNIVIWDVVGQAGLFRLRGHRDQVTGLVFLEAGKKLVSSSKDKLIRVWDLELQQCVQIVGGHHTEIWSLDLDLQERYLVSGSADPELRFYQVRHVREESDGKDKWEILKLLGEIQRQSKDRVGCVQFNKSGNLLACQAAGRTVEIYRVLDELEAKRKAKRRVQRKKEKLSIKANAKETDNGIIVDPSNTMELKNTDVIVSDVFKLLQILRASKKITSTAFSPVNPPKGALASLSLSLNNNTLETYLVESSKVTRTHTIELQGHRSDIRSLSLSSDSTLLLSTSHNAVKIWNPSTGNCLRTIQSEYGLCSAFVLQDRYALVGTKNGKLEIINVGSGSCSSVVDAHAGSVHSLVSLPNGSGFVTGGADHYVNFWEYDLDRVSKQLTVTPVRRFELNDDVLVVSLSPDGKYISVSMLDCTVKVYFMDTLKFFLSLYGHKLPVLCMDISSDGDLIVTGSADKNIRIWGLDFGDCHKSIFAHADSVMAVKFVHNSHYLFSAGKDRVVKYWDADKFELLLTLEGHHAEVWCLAISNRGDFLVTGSHDRSIRRWDRTEEPFFIEEEREKRLEEMFESDIDYSNEDRYAPKEELPEEGSVGVPGRKTRETLSATDLILDALDAAEDELKQIMQHKEDMKNGKGAQFLPNIILRGLSPSDYVLHSLSSVQANDLEQTLLSLPFSDLLKLMSYLKDWISYPDKVELVCRVTTVLLQTHHSQLTTTLAARPVLIAVKDILHSRVKECKDTIGFNLAAMDHVKELLSLKSDAPFRDAKAKLTEIRLLQSKRNNKTELKKKERQKKQKSS